MEEIVPVLMDMLDTRDSAARAVVLLVAEFFALYPFRYSYFTSCKSYDYNISIYWPIVSSASQI